MRIRALHRDFNEVTIFCILAPAVPEGEPLAVFTYDDGYLGYDPLSCFEKCVIEDERTHITYMPTVCTVEP